MVDNQSPPSATSIVTVPLENHYQLTIGLELTGRNPQRTLNAIVGEKLKSYVAIMTVTLNDLLFGRSGNYEATLSGSTPYRGGTLTVTVKLMRNWTDNTRPGQDIFDWLSQLVSRIIVSSDETNIGGQRIYSSKLPSGKGHGQASGMKAKDS